MLELKNIKKDYKTAESVVHALQGVSLNFRANEFVSVLGPSGCGKTTLLNIIGGLDHYTEGDLVICGKSTKDYKDRDWDVYRNHRIGFVFQSYNLIPHQTVLGNVELSLTIAGISKAERRQRAKDALVKVGLEKELHKRPNQLSGGQMQRVAIARALVNNPEILLADEPTGALDTKTSVQIMELIREIAGERLVIMVTHNPEIAEEYSTRIVQLKDGLVVSDSNPYTNEQVLADAQAKADAQAIEQAIEQAEEQAPQTVKTSQSDKKRKAKKVKKERSAMSFSTALGLSARNLLTKKGRTALTSVAGSIGIISVCLVLALSNGFNQYILKTQEDMLSSNPLRITETAMDTDAIFKGLSDAGEMPDLSQIGDSVYVNSFLTNIAQGMTVNNNLSDEYLAYLADMDESLYSAIVYNTGVELSNNLFTEVTIDDGTENGKTQAMSLSELKAYYTLKLTQQEEKYAQMAYLVDYLGSVYGKMPGTSDLTDEKYGEYVLEQYDLVGENSRFPQSANEAVLVVGSKNDVTDLTLAQLGFISETEFLSLFPQDGEEVTDENQSDYELMIDFDDVIGKKFMLHYNDAVYTPVTGAAAFTSAYAYNYTATMPTLDTAAEKGIEITISGILRLKDGLSYGSLGSGLYLTEKAYNDYVAVNKDSALAVTLRNQLEKTQQFGVLTKALGELSEGTEEFAAKQQEIATFITQNFSVFKRAAENLSEYYMSGNAFAETEGNDGENNGENNGGENGGENGGAQNTENAWLSNLYFLYGDNAVRSVGGKDKINAVYIYPPSFEAKDGVLAYLQAWNDACTDEADEVKYDDPLGTMMKMVESMLNAITYVLVAFTAISLVVSSVMIGIITYVSVVERTKEIGVLRSLGARKRDIRNLFNAETFIIGLTSGLFGVGVTYLLSLAINAILGSLTGIATLASLPIGSALIMVCVSVALTLISGLIPAGAAAKKDPVIALRTE